MPRKSDTAVVRTIGIDTGKNTLHMVGLDERGAIVLREKVFRHRIVARLVNVPPCLVGIEAGMATHYVARELVALGHEVKQAIAPHGQDRWGLRGDWDYLDERIDACSWPLTHETQSKIQKLPRCGRLSPERLSVSSRAAEPKRGTALRINVGEFSAEQNYLRRVINPDQ